MEAFYNVTYFVYGAVGLLFMAGVGAFMVMFAFIQFTARLAIWLDVVKAYRQRQEYALEVQQLKAALDTLTDVDVTGNDKEEVDPEKSLVEVIKFGDPQGSKEG